MLFHQVCLVASWQGTEPDEPMFGFGGSNPTRNMVVPVINHVSVAQNKPARYWDCMWLRTSLSHYNQLPRHLGWLRPANNDGLKCKTSRTTDELLSFSQRPTIFAAHVRYFNHVDSPLQIAWPSRMHQRMVSWQEWHRIIEWLNDQICGSRFCQKPTGLAPWISGLIWFSQRRKQSY